MYPIWHKTREGCQYFVRFDVSKQRLEFSSDPVSELVGGGWSEDMDEAWWADPGNRMRLAELFGLEQSHEIHACAAAIARVCAHQRIDPPSAELDAAYWEELMKSG